MEDKFYIIFNVFINLILIYKFDFFAKIINLYDNPDNFRKIHKIPVSLLGGSIILSNVILSLVYVFIFKDISYLKSYIYIYSIKSFLVLAFVIFALFLLGYLDDKFNISPLKKFSILFFLILIICMNDNLLVIDKFNSNINNYSIEFSQLSLIFSVCCYVFLIIALNMYDGVNLQSSIFYSINFIFIMLYMNQLNVVLISIIIGLITFSYLNYRNKVFLGDNGVFILSFLLGYIFVKLFNNTILFKTADIVLFLFLPVIDALRVMLERQFLKNKPIFYADKLHLHHKILEKYNFKVTIILSSILIIIPHLVYLSPMKSEYFLIINFLVYFYLIKKLNT